MLWTWEAVLISFCFPKIQISKHCLFVCVCVCVCVCFYKLNWALNMLGKPSTAKVYPQPEITSRGRGAGSVMLHVQAWGLEFESPVPMFKKPYMVTDTFITPAVGVKTGGSRGLADRHPCSKFRKNKTKSCFKGIKYIVTEQMPASSICASMHTHVCTHHIPHIHSNVHNKKRKPHGLSLILYI